jgi:hypothetical protein
LFSVIFPSATYPALRSSCVWIFPVSRLISVSRFPLPGSGLGCRLEAELVLAGIRLLDLVVEVFADRKNHVLARPRHLRTQHALLPSVDVHDQPELFPTTCLRTCGIGQAHEGEHRLLTVERALPKPAPRSSRARMDSAEHAVTCTFTCLPRDVESRLQVQGALRATMVPSLAASWRLCVAVGGVDDSFI